MLPRRSLLVTAASCALATLVIAMARDVPPDTPAPAPTFTPTPTSASPSASPSVPVPVPVPAQRWFNHRPVRPVATRTMTVTAYSPDHRSCAPYDDNVTASGYSVWTNGMRMAAADTSVLPFGTLITVPGYDDGAVIPVLDRGGRIKGDRLDVLYATHDRALRWGVRELEVTIWEYADGKPNDFRSRYR